jgi:hypothetical protein
MKSHRCDFKPSELAPTLGWPLVFVAGFALAMHTGTRAGLWPSPRPALDTERTILVHQADACRQTDPVRSPSLSPSPSPLPPVRRAPILLLGDSSCLMDVSARRLAGALGTPVLNVGTFSFLDLPAHARLLQEYVRHQSSPPSAVVLLMHPEALRRLDAEPYYLAALTNYLAGRDHSEDDSWAGRIDVWTGLEAFRGRVLARLVPAPLSGAYGRRYGFSRDFEIFLESQHGSAVDPEVHPLEGTKEYRLAAGLDRASARFRAAMPDGTPLLVGITPVAESLAGRGFPAQRDEMLRQWGGWLRADALLAELPARWPDARFARSTHLREEAIPEYTALVAQALRDKLKR